MSIFIVLISLMDSQDVHIGEPIKGHPLDMCILLHVNNRSLKLLRERGAPISKTVQ